MKYFKDENNKVFAFDDEQIKQGYGKDLISISEDESMAIANPPKTEKELEEVRINTINQKANEVIEAKYPLYKQLNVRAKLIKDEDGSHYTDTDIEIMDMFIDAVRSIAKQAKANGTLADEVDWNNLDNG